MKNKLVLSLFLLLPLFLFSQEVEPDVALFGSLRTGFNSVHYSDPGLGQVVGGGLSQEIEISAHSLEVTGWYLGVGLGYNTTSVRTADIPNTRRSNFSMKINLGFTDGKYIAAGLVGGHLSSDTRHLDTQTLGFFFLFKYPITEKIWISLHTDAGAQFSDVFTGLEQKSPLAASILFGGSYSLN